MTANVLDLTSNRPDTSDGMATIREYLKPLLGESFQFLRFSYGDELNLHFGVLRDATSPKVKHKYGSYILSTRASSWVIKTKDGLLISSSEQPVNEGNAGQQTTIEVEQSKPIATGARVVSMETYPIDPSGFIGLTLVFNDQTTFCILPSSSDSTEEPDVQGVEIGDWELTMPQGHLTVGPGDTFAYEAEPKSEQIPSLPIATPVEMADI